MKSFFTSVLASISSTEFYQQVLYRPFWQVVRFYLVFMILVVLILTTQYWYITKPVYNQAIEGTIQEVLHYYPSELVIEWNGNELRSNQTPLYVPLPNTLPENVTDLAQYALVISSEEEPSPTINTLFIASPSNLYTVSDSQLSQGISLRDLLGEESFQITQHSLPGYLEQAKYIGTSIVTISGYLFPVISYVFLVLSSLIVLILDTFIIFLFIKLQRIAISYTQLLQLGIALLVPAQIIDLVTKLANLEVPFSMLSLSFWILFIVVFFSLQRKLTI